MKRWLSILAVFGCIVALSGCKNENEKRQAYFNAKVLEINKEYCSHRIESPYHSISHLLQKSEAFQSVHHVTFILCYTVL